jgi:LDH2 family malate/lactate/ureidoglycolate dehydrogenase
MAELAGALFRAAGAPADEAALTADHLVTSSLMGCDSHGIMRVPEYLAQVVEGTIVPGAPVVVERRSGATARVDCGRNFGPVGATRAMEVAIAIAGESGVACVTTHRCNHVARLGAYAQQAAECGLIAIATCNSPIGGHFVLPWGGKEGRLATNPIAYAVPTGGDPILADFATSVAPEGKVRWYRNSGLPLPPGWIQDADGRPSTDPDAFYGPPRGGLVPLGGPVGYKGFALGLLVEILGSALAGIGSADASIVGNGVCCIAIDPTRFVPFDRFRSLMDDLSAYVRSSPPAEGAGEVLMPGAREFRTRRARLEEGIAVDDATWDALRGHAARLGLDWQALIAS